MRLLDLQLLWMATLTHACRSCFDATFIQNVRRKHADVADLEGEEEEEGPSSTTSPSPNSGNVVGSTGPWKDCNEHGVPPHILETPESGKAAASARRMYHEEDCEGLHREGGGNFLAMCSPDNHCGKAWNNQGKPSTWTIPTALHGVGLRMTDGEGNLPNHGTGRLGPASRARRSKRWATMLIGEMGPAWPYPQKEKGPKPGSSTDMGPKAVSSSDVTPRPRSSAVDKKEPEKQSEMSTQTRKRRTGGRSLDLRTGRCLEPRARAVPGQKPAEGKPPIPPRDAQEEEYTDEEKVVNRT